MCGGGCGIDCILEDGVLTKIKGNPDDLFNYGRLCIKGSSAIKNINHPDRLKKALKKTENGFVEIEVEQAMDEIAERVKEIQKKHGERSIAVWKGEGSGFAQNENLFRRFIHAIGSPNYFSNDTQCWAGRNLGYTLVHGDWPLSEFEFTKLLFI